MNDDPQVRARAEAIYDEALIAEARKVGPDMPGYARRVAITAMLAYANTLTDSNQPAALAALDATPGEGVEHLAAALSKSQIYTSDNGAQGESVTLFFKNADDKNAFLDAHVAHLAERRRAALQRMTAMDEEMEARHPGWMTGLPKEPLPAAPLSGEVGE